MSFLMRQVAHCDVCGHEWLTNKVPIHCAKCKSRKWNKGALDVEIVHVPRSEWPQSVRDLLSSASLAAPKHAPTCKCLMCKPPK